MYRKQKYKTNLHQLPRLRFPLFLWMTRLFAGTCRRTFDPKAFKMNDTVSGGGGIVYGEGRFVLKRFWPGFFLTRDFFTGSYYVVSETVGDAATD